MYVMCMGACERACVHVNKDTLVKLLNVIFRCSSSTFLAFKLQMMELYDIKFALRNNIKFSSSFYLPHLRKK